MRYMAEVYKVITQTVPVTAKDEEMESIVDYLGGMIRQVDSSLLDEWEKLRNPNYVPAVEDPESLNIGAADITRNQREFYVAIRNEAFFFVKGFAHRDFEGLAAWAKDSASPENEGQSVLSAEYFARAFESYSSDHQGPLTDRVARHPKHVAIAPKETKSDTLIVRQTLIDAEEHNDVFVTFKLSIQRCRDAGRVYLEIVELQGIHL